MLQNLEKQKQNIEEELLMERISSDSSDQKAKKLNWNLRKRTSRVTEENFFTVAAYKKKMPNLGIEKSLKIGEIIDDILEINGK